jgi:hypothetical protein
MQICAYILRTIYRTVVRCNLKNSYKLNLFPDCVCNCDYIKSNYGKMIINRLEIT